MEFEVFEGINSQESGLNVNKFIDRNITKVLVGNIGPSTFNEITSSGCKIYLCRNMQVSDAVTKVNNNEIKTLDNPTLQNSIHSAREGSDNGRGNSRGIRRWFINSKFNKRNKF